MGSKKKVRNRKSGTKTSASKLANKRSTKSSNQDKRQKVAAKNQRKQKRAQKAAAAQPQDQATHSNLRVRAVTTSSTVIPLEDEDVAYYSTPGQNTSFASTVHTSLLTEDAPVSNRRGKKRRRDGDEDEDEEDYEQLPRKLFTPEKNMKMVLPIKTKKGGVVPHWVEEDEAGPEAEPDDHMAESNDQEEEEPAEAEPLPELSNVELYALRQKKLADRKRRIASLSNTIIENPEENVKKLRELVLMLHEKDADVYVTVRKYVMVSLLEIFKDIIPGYHIRLPTDKERQQKMKKETLSLLSHEESLLRSYQQYLEFLERTAKGARKKKKKKKEENDEVLSIPANAQQSLLELSVRCMCELLNKHPHFNYTNIIIHSLLELSVRCMCELLNKHPHFNYTNNIISVLVPYMANYNAKVSDTVCECVKTAFKEDKTGTVTLEITKCVGRLIKARNFMVDPKILQTFLSLRIKEVSYTDPLGKEDAGKEKKKTNFEKLSRKDKKRKKKEMVYEKDLQETRATEDKKQRLKRHTEVIQAIFVTYFRILKKATHSILLPTVLEGLAKFAHLINVDFFDDLFTVFNKLIETEELSYRESLHCVQTAFTILTGQGSVLNIDPILFYRHLYKNLFHIHAGYTSEDIPIILRCLDLMISQRKRQVSQQRVLAYTKRLTTMALLQTPAGSVALLTAVRSLMLTYKYTDSLLDNEAQGSGVYLPELEDPEHCNAHNTVVWELASLQRHFDPKVRRLASHLSRGAPVTGEGQLPVELRKQAQQLFEELDTLEAEIFPASLPEKAPKPKHKMKLNGLIQPDFSTEVLAVLERVGNVPGRRHVT